jgi:type I restriction enzyme S subunit
MELDDESIPFTAPPGWTWTTLGRVQVFTNGYAFKSEDYQPTGVGIIRMGELGANGEIDETNMKYVSDEISQSLPDTFRVNPGDLLMGMSGSIGKLAVNRSNKTYLLNQRVGRLEPILIEKAFLHVFLKTVEQHYLRISFGMAIKNLSTKQINETPFPLPPLAEQKRIVAKVDELMTMVDQLEMQIAASRATATNLLEALVAELIAAT